ncbi:hypothetical protein ABH979_001845 [Bradyrhizobium ottawaense]
MNSGKPLPITKRMVWEAYKLVKKGKAAGVDGQSLEDFAGDLENHRYRLWNRLVSGSYFPPPVRRVEIPKAGGWDSSSWHTDGRGPYRPDGGQTVSGAGVGWRI